MTGRASKRPETPLLEWIASGVGLAMLAAVIVVIGREALNGEASAPPAIEVSVTGISRSGAGYVVGIEATNRSGGTAAAVTIEGVIKDGEAELETSTAILDYVPGHSRREGGLFFREDPRRHPIEVRALGFQTP